MTTTMRRIEFRKKPTRDERLPIGYIDIPECAGFYGINEQLQVWSIKSEKNLKCDDKTHNTMHLHVLGTSMHIMKSQLQEVYNRAFRGVPISPIVKTVYREH